MVDNGWIQTYSGKKFYPLLPTVDSVDIRDIAHALSLVCRFGGHSLVFYSVAQHSVFVSKTCDPEDSLWGLLHDAAEAYLCDLPRPVKHDLRRRCGSSTSFFDDFENGLMRVICQKFGLPEAQPTSVRVADTVLLATEARDLMAPAPEVWQSSQGVLLLPETIHPWGWQHAEQEFLQRFQDLTE